MSKHYLVCPAYYQGTSFDQIVRGMQACAQKEQMELHLLGLKRTLRNSLRSDWLEDHDFYACQQAAIADSLKALEQGAKLLFLDFFFPGIDVIKYYIGQNDLQVKLGALLHGGAFLDHDAQSKHYWLRSFELAYFDTFDAIYAPSQFLKSQCPDGYRDKIKVKPWGMDGVRQPPTKAERIFDVVFPHRVAADKGIDDFIFLVQILKDVWFCLCVPQPSSEFIAPPYKEALLSAPNLHICYAQNEEQHLHTLASSKIVLSCAKQENFGYSVHKAVNAGCIPILPERLCYPEFFKPAFLYQSLPHAAELIRDWRRKHDAFTPSAAYLGESAYTFSDIIKDFYHG